jgi:hypothetical protein
MYDRQVMALGFLPPIGTSEILRMVKNARVNEVMRHKAGGKDLVQANHRRRVRGDNSSENTFDITHSGAGLHGCQLVAAMSPAMRKSCPANC